MDQSSVSKAKSEEKRLSSEIYTNLSILSKYYGSSEELKKCLSEDMFSKTNPSAFFHVMHFIFHLYDPVEFRKRFFWPISDKKSESTFRTSTMDYLNYLNEKHNLQWNIKSYLVVMPGGMKFIKFLYDLMCFVSKELRKKAEKLISDEDKEEFSGNPWLAIAKLKHCSSSIKCLASQFTEQADYLKNTIKNSYNELKTELNRISEEIKVPLNELNDEFFDQFEKSNAKLYEEIVNEQTKLKSMSKEVIEPCKDSLKNLETYHCGKMYNETNVKNFLISNGFITAKSSAQLSCLSDFSLEELIKGVTMITPNLQQYYDHLQHNTKLSNSVVDKLKENQSFSECISTECEQYMQKLQSLEKYLSQKKTPTKNTLSQFSEQRLANKFISTPTIKLDMPSCSRDTVPRLPLQGDPEENHLSTFNNYEALQTPARNVKRLDCTYDLNISSAHNSTLQRSKIIDPMQLLRTISKDKPSSSSSTSFKGANISALSLKWKQNHNYLMGESKESNSATVIQTSPNETPFNMNEEKTRIENPMNPEVESTPQANEVNVKQPRKSALMKIQNDSQLKNLNSSPSGRLEALVPGNDFIVPEVNLISDTNQIEKLNFSEVENEENQPPPVELNKSVTGLNMRSKVDLFDETPKGRFNELDLQKERGKNLGYWTQLKQASPLSEKELDNENLQTKPLNNLVDSFPEEFLLNTSDTVLKDLMF